MVSRWSANLAAPWPAHEPEEIAQAILFGTTFFGLYIVWDRKVDVLVSDLAALPSWRARLTRAGRLIIY